MKRPHFPFAILLGLLAWMMTACIEPVEIQLPEHESQLVVEGYVEPDEFFICSVFETVSYFSDPKVPVLDDAVVVLSSSYFTDTLEWVLAFGEIGYYQGHYVIPRDYNTLWRLEVSHPASGRSAWAETTMHPPQTVDSVGFEQETPGTQRLIVYLTDTAGRPDHYYYWAGPTPSESPSDAFYFRDQYFDGVQYACPTAKEWPSGNVIYIRMLHIHPDYYDFLKTLDQANSIGIDLVQEPLNVRGNVHGALGIFTGFDAPAFPVYVP